jgi:demethylmenaquinone methyltransferase/2-methoxy-6-polyprenyl-1,4-benzoquinol methylase
MRIGGGVKFIWIELFLRKIAFNKKISLPNGMEKQIEEKNNHPLKDFYKDIYGTYDLVNRIFTFGQDKKWRRKAVRACLQNEPEKIIDICTGTGDLILEISKRTPKKTLLAGYDFSAEMLQKANDKAKDSKSTIEFKEGDVAAMPYKDKYFDTAGISFGIRNLIYQNSKADQHLAEIHRILRIGGQFVILESSKPENQLWRFINSIYLQFILPYLGGIISGNLKAYKYLAKSSKNYYTPTQMSEILERGGFKVVQSQSLFLGSVMLMVAEKQNKSNRI